MIYPWQQSTWDKYTNARSQNHLPHALLLSGDKGIGKLHLAKAMVKSLLCTSTNNQSISSKNTLKYQACNVCQSCKTYESGANPDYLHIELAEGKQQITIDQIRELSEFLTLTTSFSGYRVILLHPVERMNRNAANSLLKSLEEPSNKTILLLTTANLSQIIPTIKSRCQLLMLPMPNQEQSLAWLKKHKPDHSNPLIALDIANGKPLKAIEIDDGIIKNREDLSNDILSILEKKKSITEVAKHWEKFDLSTMLDWQIRWLQSYIKNLESPSKTHESIKEKLSIKHQWSLHQALMDQKQLVHTSVNPLIFIENMLISWIQIK